MNELREIYDAGKPEVISERKRPDGDTMLVRVPWIQADKKNQNKRLYPLALLQREVSRIQKAVDAGSFVGTGDHPIGGLADIKTASHIVNKVWLDEKGKGWADIRIVGTERGNAIMTLIRNNAQLGISARGFGSVDEKTGEILSDYTLVGIDVVMNPSYEKGVFNKSDIFESLNLEEENPEDRKVQLIKEHHKKAEENVEADLMFGLTEDYVEAMIESVYGMQIDEGSFEGSLEDFKAKKSNLVKAEILCAHKHFETTEEALEHLGAHEEAKRISSAAPVQKRVTLADCFYEAQMAGIDPQEYCDRINANIDRQEALESEPDFTVQEIASILDEAQKAGIDTTNPKERKRMLDLARERKKQPETLTEEENFIKFATDKGVKVETAKALWEEKQKEKKRKDEIHFRIKEEGMAGFGREQRPSARKRSKKIIEGE